MEVPEKHPRYCGFIDFYYFKSIDYLDLVVAGHGFAYGRLTIT